MSDLLMKQVRALIKKDKSTSGRVSFTPVLEREKVELIGWGWSLHLSKDGTWYWSDNLEDSYE